jgi:hypothetical protein
MARAACNRLRPRSQPVTVAARARELATGQTGDHSGDVDVLVGVHAEHSVTWCRGSRQGRTMATDFAVFLHRFLTSHLAGLRGCSPNTIASYP